MAHAWRQHLENNPVEASLDGYHEYDDRWGDPSLAAQRKAEQEARDNLEALHRIDRDALDPADQLNWRMFEYTLRDELATDEQPDTVIEMMSQITGPQLASELTEQLRFNTQQDYQNWVKRLQTINGYLSAFIERLRFGLNRGISQPAIVMKRVPGEIAAEIAPRPEESPFYAPFKRMPDTISAEEQAELRAAAKAAIADVVNPAYEKLAAFVEDDYLPKARKRVGALALPQGKAYYDYAVKHYTTTDLTPSQVHHLGLEQVARIQAEMESVFSRIGFKGSYEQFLRHLRHDPRFYYTNADDLLEAYRAAAKRVDPQLVKIAGTWLLPRVPYGVRPIPAAEAPNTYVAYSVPPAGDGSVAGYVAVNLYEPQSRPKYEIQVLMCHEGRPGHQLQMPIAMELDGLPAFRRFAYYNAYGEGWALYSETLGDELGLYDNSYSKFGYLNYQMWRAVRLVVDTGLHYYGWSRERAIEYMQTHTALSEENITNEVDRYIAWPGQALSYMIGQLEILRLRTEARQRLGAKYSLRDFDDAVLGQGSLPMTVLSDVVHRWIANTLDGKPADQLPYATKPRSASR